MIGGAAAAGRATAKAARAARVARATRAARAARAAPNPKISSSLSQYVAIFVLRLLRLIF